MHDFGHVVSDRSSGKDEIQEMFAAISKKYDLLNRLLSLNRDKYWREIAVSELHVKNGSLFLDLCAGTGDVGIEIIRQDDFYGSVIAGDFCREMLKIGVMKCQHLGINNIEFICADAEHLAFTDNLFDGVIIAFGIRNVQDKKQTLSELARALQKGGRVVILEFGIPTNRFFKQIYHLYFRKILPSIGRIISRNSTAYSYLPDSVKTFPKREEFAALMQDSGIREVRYFNLTCGIVTIYVGIK